MDVLKPTPDHPLILNLPATVECATPNVYADQIEWFGRNFRTAIRWSSRCTRITTGATAGRRRRTGRDGGRGPGRGCLLGNGERTGNCDLVTVALNMYTQGVDPSHDLSDIDEVVNTVHYCTNLPVHPRTRPMRAIWSSPPFRAAIRTRSRRALRPKPRATTICGKFPYLPIDPADLGRSYEAVIRVNSQSGKGGVAWVIEQDKGLKLPKRLQADFSSAATSRHWPTPPAAS